MCKGKNIYLYKNKVNFRKTKLFLSRERAIFKKVKRRPSIVKERPKIKFSKQIFKEKHEYNVITSTYLYKNFTIRYRARGVILGVLP